MLLHVSALTVGHPQRAIVSMCSLYFSLYVRDSTYNKQYCYDDSMLQFLQSVL